MTPAKRKIKWTKKALKVASELANDGFFLDALDKAIEIQFPDGIIDSKALREALDAVSPKPPDFFLAPEEADLLYRCLANKYVGDYPGVGDILNRIRRFQRINEEFPPKPTLTKEVVTKAIDGSRNRRSK